MSAMRFILIPATLVALFYGDAFGQFPATISPLAPLNGNAGRASIGSEKCVNVAGK